MTSKYDIMLITTKTVYQIKRRSFSMSIITSSAHFRQRVIKKSYKIGVTEASKYYKISRNAIYEWRRKYDGKSWKSLLDKSHRPHHHPNEHTEAEKEMIMKRYPYYKDDMVMLWDSLRKDGYTRCYNSLVRVINKWIKPEKAKKEKQKAKPYKRAEYPGQKMQLDVKFVPSYCVTNGKKYYQYTAIDECSRWVFREIYEEHSTYSSVDFLRKLIQNCPFPIREIQTDNGTEWTRALISNDGKLSAFEKALEGCNIKYHRIRVATPRHNGKVERQHRTDEKRFYKKMRMFNLDDGRQQLKRYNQKSNNIPKTCLDFQTPNEVLQKYLGVM